MRDLILRFKNDSIVWKSCLISALLLIFHVYQLIDSDYRIEPLIRVIFYASFIVCVFFFGRKIIPYAFYAFSLALGSINSFENYTPFFITALACFLLPKAEYPLLSFYGLDTIFVCVAHGKSPIHLLIHLLNCIFIYAFLKLLIEGKANHKQKLILKEDEIKILEELRAGKQQKEIDLFNKNTITKKLREARDRNNIGTTEELLLRYIASLV